MKLFLSVYKTCFSLGSSFLLFLEKPDNSRCYTIAGTTILQTTPEDADNTQFFIDGKTKTGGKSW